MSKRSSADAILEEMLPPMLLELEIQSTKVDMFEVLIGPALYCGFAMLFDDPSMDREPFMH